VSRHLLLTGLRAAGRTLAEWLGVSGSRGGARRGVLASEARLRLALEAAGMATWEMDAETGEIWWSDEGGRLFGEAGGVGVAATRLPHVVQRIHPEDRARFQTAVARAVADDGGVHRLQARVVWPDGTVRWLEARGRSWLDSGGRLGLRGSLLDVTDIKRGEEDLRRNLEELRVITSVAERAAEARAEESLLQETTDVLRGSLFTESCGFLLLDPESEMLVHASSVPAGQGQERPSPVPLGQGVVGEVASSGDPRRIGDTRAVPPYVEREPGMLSEICVPLKVGTRVLGVLNAESRRQDAFSARDERLLLVVASHVANALERLRSEEALRRSGDLYRAYFTASPLAVFVSDLGGRYLEVNGAATAMTGYSRDELLRMSVPDLLVAEGGPELKDRLSGLLALGAGRHEIQIRRKDGSLRHCLVHAAAIGDDRLLGFLFDVTDRREAEEKLRESEERYRGLSEASLEAILVHDGGRIVDVNHALCELGGYSWHELVGRDGFELIAPEDRERVYRTLLVEYEKPYEITVVRRDGARIPVELRARSFPFQGRVLRMVALRDVSERRRAEELRESLIRDLEVKNAELERFTHTVSHDLKAPLITIRGFSQYLLAALDAGSPERAAEDARRIAEAAGKMQRLLDHLVELSHAGRPADRPAPVPLDALVREAVRLVEGRRAETHVVVDVADGLPVVLGDHARLLQVFQNLLDNAVKFAADAEEPRVSVEPAGGEAGTAEIVVRDNGRGLDPVHRERVFGLFEKLDPRAEGTGVGLAVVKRIVETHGGRVCLDSRGLGRGTEVRVILPVPSETEEAVAGTEIAAATATEEARRPRE
jgi:PAS domain S-box-containing protein